MRVILFFIFGLILFSCTGKAKQEKWRRLDCGLYINSRGDLGFATAPDLVNVSREDRESEECNNVFITWFDRDTAITLTSIIDTASFHHVVDHIYQDKNHTYQHYPMCESGYLWIVK